jgi:hypothetical protein
MKSLVLVGLVCVVAATGCNRDRVTDRDRTGSATITGGNVATVPNQSGIDRIVGARCAREAACNNIGADKRYSDQNACTQKIRGDMHDDLNTRDCPAGVDSKELDECLAEIKNQDCNNPLDLIGRLAACRTSDMCKHSNAPNR